MRNLPQPNEPHPVSRRAIAIALALACAALVTAPALAAKTATSPPAAKAAPAAKPVRTGLEALEKQVREFTLPNGLKFMVVERHDAPANETRPELLR